MKLACQYAIVRFLPLIETGEFANVGVVLFAPKTGFLGFKLAPATFPRVTQFFGELDRKVYRQAILGFDEELTEVQRLAEGKYGEDLMAFAKEITRVRESLLRFSELRTVLTADPRQALNDIYNRFVGRDFVNQQYREKAMVSAIKNQLAENKLDKKYVRYTFEADLRKVPFPLVNKYIQEYRVMKPLAFDQSTASKIIDHGELWRHKIQWLIERDVLRRENILLPIEAPKSPGSDLMEAYDIARKDLRELKIEIVDFNNKQRIVEFAREGMPFDNLH